MPRVRAYTLLAAALLGLSACAGLDPGRTLRVGVSVESEVVASQGRPSRVWRDDDGGSTLEYSTQPFGQTCLMFKLDAGGRLQGFHDALQTAARERVQPGMTMDQVSRLLGSERRRMTFHFSGEEVWDWNVPPIHVSGLMRFNVHFKDGRVVRTSYSMVTPERPFMGR